MASSKEAREEIISSLSAKYAVTKYTLKEMIPTILNMIVEETKKKKRVQFGPHVFYLKTTKARTARNPRTGEPVEVPEKTRIGYKNKRAVMEG